MASALKMFLKKFAKDKNRTYQNSWNDDLIMRNKWNNNEIVKKKMISNKFT